MDILRRLLDGLGNPGAARNAHGALLAHAAEDRALEALLDHLAVADRGVATAA